MKSPFKYKEELTYHKMENRPKISIILPSYNDREIIRPFYDAICRVLEAQSRYEWEMIYVDDGSTDGSVEELKKLASENSKITFIELSRNFGQQKAYFTGMKRVSGDIVITLDGDYQYNPECLIPLADEVMKGFDIVGGIRTSRRDPWFSRFTSRIGRYLICRALRIKVTDFGSVRAFSRFLVDQIIKYENYCLTVHGISYALTNRYTEIPVQHLPRPSGRSKWSALKRVHLLFDIFLGFGDSQLIGLTKLGIFFSGTGFFTLAILLYLYLRHQIFFFHTFTAVTALSLMGLGFILVLGSFGLSFLLRVYRILLWKGDATIVRKIYGIQSKDLN